VTRTKKIVLSVIGAIFVLAIVAYAPIAMRSPRTDRTWIAEQERAPQVVFDGDIVRIANVRSFRYTARRAFTPRYVDRTYDLRKLQSVSYVLTPFKLSFRGPAHSFVTFAFADSQFVSISIEARREPGESYELIKGMLRNFEVLYVVGEEADVIGQRAAFDSSHVYLYPIRATKDKVRAMFVSMLERANQLREQPEFYNTVTNNCTSKLIAHVNAVAPGTVPASWRILLPGYSDELGIRLGLIDAKVDIEKARAQYLINDRARKHLNDSLFSFRIREPIQ
jgi:hypothetical protein